jgi:hypothetical protein
MHEAISLGESLGHAATLAQPLTQLPWALQINGDAETTLIESERALAFEAEVVHPQFFGIAHAMRGWALVRMGRTEDGVAELERALADELRSSDIWAAMTCALRSALALARLRSTACAADLKLLGDLCTRLPRDNVSDYGREAKALLDEAGATTSV